MPPKRILCTGNPETGLAKAIFEKWPEADFCSQTTWGYDLTLSTYKEALSVKALEYDIFINSSALWQFHQTMLLNVVYKRAEKANHSLHIVSIGSTTDRTTKGSDWQYQQEKKALRSTSNALNLKSTWQGGPRVSYVTFGTLENYAHKHPERTCMSMTDAVRAIEYIIEFPPTLIVNELSIDPIQTNWPKGDK